MRQTPLLLALLLFGSLACSGRDHPPADGGVRDSGPRPDGGPDEDGGIETNDGGPNTVDRVEVTPNTLTIQVDEMQTLTARALDQNGNELTRTIEWSSSNPTQAIVSANGTVTGIAEGTSVITASADQKSATAMITIVPRNDNPVATVELNETFASLLVGETIQLNATARDAGGVLVPGRPVTWTSANQSVATVSNSGLVSAAGPGNTQVTATIDGISASATIDVTEPQIEPGDVELDIGTTFQTMTGWEATAQMGQWECDQTAYANYHDPLIDRAVNELGINRIRLELYSGAESSIDWFFTAQFNQHRYTPENDNADPNMADPAGFQWGHVDSQIDEVVNPFRSALQTRGEQLYVSLCVVDFEPASHTFEHRQNPSEYAELVLAAFEHIESTYGWVPDGFEILLEPDVAGWTESNVGNAFIAAADRLEAAGYQPNYTLPSNTNMWAAINSYDTISNLSGATGRITELSYHRYNGTGLDAAMAVGDRVRIDGVQSAMLEHIGSGTDDLFQDLTVAQVSAWQQFTIGFCGPPDTGAKYYIINQSNPANPTLTIEYLARFFTQVFRHVRRGAVRHGMNINDQTLSPLAFQNTNGDWVVIVRTQGSKSFSIGGLPAGTYGVYYTTDSALASAQADITINTGEAIHTSIPAAGLLTVFQR